jgi:hypothetical protein
VRVVKIKIIRFGADLLANMLEKAKKLENKIPEGCF